MNQFLKTLVVYSTAFLSVCCLYAQPNINSVEYYIDNDPGYGNASSVQFTPGANLSDLMVHINPDILSIGTHLLGIRAKDSKGSWSLDNKWLFVKNATPAATPGLVKIEYYIDTDPGYNKSTDISIIPGTNLSNLTQSINPTAISTGVHIFGIRAKDVYGVWSLDSKWLFVKDVSARIIPSIINAEYYIDRDPGYGKANPINITPSTDLHNVTADINPDNLSMGVHVFGIRAKDANGAWSSDNKWLFVKDALLKAIPNIVRVEYYVDSDPGYGKALPADITPSTNLINIMQDVNVGTLGDGAHFIGIRALDANGAWSLDNKLPFTIVNGPLPVILSNFKGRYIDGTNELTAVIEYAVNVKSIEVERSGDGTHFTYHGNMAIAPVNSGTLKYVDKNPAAGNIFYRLRIVDMDGKVSYSDVILLNHSSQFTIQMYPNPVQDNLTAHFENAATGIYAIRLTDILGKNILFHKINISQNNQTGDVNISFSRYAAGIYFIQVTDALNKIVTTQRIIKK